MFCQKLKIGKHKLVLKFQQSLQDFVRLKLYLLVFDFKLVLKKGKKKIIIRNLHNLIMRNCDQLMFGLSQLDVTGEQTREQNKEQCFVSTRNNNNNNKKYDPLATGMNCLTMPQMELRISQKKKEENIIILRKKGVDVFNNVTHGVMFFCL